MKRVEMDSEELGYAIDALMAPMRYHEAVQENPPIGSWHLYVEDYCFLDSQDKAEFFLDLIPSEGLSKASTTFDITAKNITVTCNLADKLVPRGEPLTRSWTFSIAPAKPVVPDKCKVYLYCLNSRVHIVAPKLTKGYWTTPGTLHAPLTKSNYLRAAPPPDQ